MTFLRRFGNSTVMLWIVLMWAELKSDKFLARNEDAEYAGEHSSENGKINVLPGRIIRVGLWRNLCEEQGEGKQRCTTDKGGKRWRLCAALRKQKAWMGQSYRQML